MVVAFLTLPSLLAMVPKVTSAMPFPSMCVASVMTLAVGTTWHSPQAMGVITVEATCLSCRPTLTFVATLRPWMSTGGAADRWCGCRREAL